jgi:hypothetical protein
MDPAQSESPQGSKESIFRSKMKLKCTEIDGKICTYVKGGVFHDSFYPMIKSMGPQFFEHATSDPTYGVIPKCNTVLLFATRTHSTCLCRETGSRCLPRLRKWDTTGQDL